VTDESKLPALPEAVAWRYEYEQDDGAGGCIVYRGAITTKPQRIESDPLYTAEQMHAYASQAVAAVAEDAGRLDADRALVAQAVKARDEGGKVHPWDVFVWAESVRPGLWRGQYDAAMKENDHAR
jgi:hypothetical protein